ncbi:hypothetical protein P8452_32800 [Trifolium repens]|nr:hypothetical protein P8452_32800 [Trifolium repens]
MNNIVSKKTEKERSFVSVKPAAAQSSAAHPIYYCSRSLSLAAQSPAALKSAAPPPLSLSLPLAGTSEENGGEKEKASNSVFNQKYHQFRIEEVFNE